MYMYIHIFMCACVCVHAVGVGVGKCRCRYAKDKLHVCAESLRVAVCCRVLQCMYAPKVFLDSINTHNRTLMYEVKVF